MRRSTFAVLSLFLLASLSLHAQVAAVQRSGYNLPVGQVPAPNTPGGVAVIFNSLFEGDGAQGLRRFGPADPANTKAIASGFFVFDSAHSLGGGGLCFPVCKVGQVVDGGLRPDGNETVFFPSYDHSGGGNSLTVGGVYRVIISPNQGGAGTPAGPVQFNVLAPTAGLAGDQPSSLALGPDGDLYVGFMKNGNVKRILNPYLDPSDPNFSKLQVVQSVGGSPNGRPIRSLTFVGSDLYIGSSDSFSVIHNAVSTLCQGGCNALPVADGFPGAQHVGVSSDSAGNVYAAINGQGVWRYTPATGRMSLISTGGFDPNTGVALTFAFVGGNTNLLQVDGLGNLWIGDDISDGVANFSGRIWSISAGQLATIP